MKVRDLRQYIKAISKGKETLELVGSNQEYCLNMMSGQGQKVDALITSAASFANNAKEQLFYEFVQNAFDANADTLLFYANEDFLIVLNNGEPFSMIQARPQSSSNLLIADWINNNCISPEPGAPAGNLPLSPFNTSALTASSSPSGASLPPQGVPKGGFSITNLILTSEKQSAFIVS